MRSELTSEVKLAINDYMLHDLIISSLKSHSDLSGIHALLRAKLSENPQDVTISFIENQVSMILTDVKPETSKASQDEPIVSLTTAYFTQKKNRSIRGNIISTQADRQSKRIKKNSRSSAFQHQFGRKCRRKHVINLFKNKERVWVYHMSDVAIAVGVVDLINLSSFPTRQLIPITKRM
jgi:hypothetical protein